MHGDEAARGEGHGRALVRAAIERARARGCKRIQLDVNEANERAANLYKSLGFTPVHAPAAFGDSPDYLFTLKLG